MLRAAPYLLHQSYHQELHWCSRGRAAKGQVGWRWLDFDPASRGASLYLIGELGLLRG